MKNCCLVLSLLLLASASIGQGCDDPKPPKHGSWFCQDQSCHLECEPGYAAAGRTHTSRGTNCDDWTVHPNKMKCSSAVALVIGGLLDVKGAEVYGPWQNKGKKPKCHYRLPDLPDTRVGATLDYVDSFIIACGGSMIKGPPIPPFPPARNTCIAMTPEGTWLNHSIMHAGRDVHSSAVNLGKLTLLGGTDAPTSRDTLEPAKSSEWTEETIKETKYACTAKLSPTEFMVSGGEFNPAEVLKYNVVTGEITPLENLIQERSGHGCAFVKHKDMVGVMVAGGLPQGNEEWTEDVTRATTDHAEFYNMETGKWQVVGKLNEARRGIRLVFVKNTLYAMGGFNGEKYVATVERFCFKTKTWSKVEDMLAARAFPGVVAVPETLFQC